MRYNLGNDAFGKYIQTAHMMLYIGEICRNGIQHYAPTDDLDSFISLLLILLYGLIWFYAYQCYICLPISANRLCEWLMILPLFGQLTLVNVPHSIVVLYYYGFLINEGIGLILVIQTLYPFNLIVLYNKDMYPTSSIVRSTTFPFNICKSH